MVSMEPEMLSNLYKDSLIYLQLASPAEIQLLLISISLIFGEKARLYRICWQLKL